MRYTVLCEGVPIGTVELKLPRFPRTCTVSGRLVPAPAYDAVRPVLQLALEAGRGLGFLGGVTPEGEAAGRAALAAEHALRFALDDAEGTPVSVRHISVLDGGEPIVGVTVGAEPEKGTPIGARLPPRPPLEGREADQLPN